LRGIVANRTSSASVICQPRPIDGLVPDPQNARTHDEANLASIAASLARYGQRTPLVVNRTGRLAFALPLNLLHPFDRVPKRQQTQVFRFLDSDPEMSMTMMPRYEEHFVRVLFSRAVVKVDRETRKDVILGTRRAVQKGVISFRPWRGRGRTRGDP